METRSVDVAVIGAGTAGLVAYREAARRCRQAVLIEEGEYGTTCARVGCMPSKLLIAAAEAAHRVAGAGRFGIEVSGWRVDGKAVLERLRRERQRFVNFTVESTEEIPAANRLRGAARFLGANELQVGEQRVRMRAVVVATGARPWVPPKLEQLRHRLLLSDDVFGLDDLPGSLAVIGTGAVGLEIGQALGRLGVRTALFSPFAELGVGSDPEVGAAKRRLLGGELDLHLGCDIDVEEAAAGMRVRWRSAEDSGAEEFAQVLVAAGRRADLSRLDLPKAGVALDAGGLPRFDPRTMQSGDLPVFFAGDAAGDRPVLHEAADEGHIAGANAADFPEVRAQLRRTPLGIVFTDPQMAVVGAAYRQLDPGEIEIGAVDYEDQGRARIAGRNAGLVRIYARRERGTLVGAEMFGPEVEHTAHLLAWAVQSRMTVEDALGMPFYHPVFEEGIRSALQQLSARLKLRRFPRPRDLECGPGT